MNLSSLTSYVLNSREEWVFEPVEEKEKFESKTMEKAVGNYSTIFPKNV